MKKIILATLLICLANICAYSQNKPVKEVLIGWDLYKNDMPPNAKYKAYTYYDLRSAYKAVKIVGNNLILDFDVSIVLDTMKSYFKVKDKFVNIRLLKHEQGHVNIGLIYARKLLTALKKDNYNKENYANLTHSIYVNIRSQMEKENERYDNETEHYLNDEAQNHWNDYFKENM